MTMTLVTLDDEQALHGDATLALSRASVDFFRDAAKRQGVPYQRMIRALVDEYARRQGS